MKILYRGCPFCGEAVTNVSYEGRGSKIVDLSVHCPKCNVDISVSSQYCTLYGNDEPIEDMTPDVADVWNRSNTLHL